MAVVEGFAGAGGAPLGAELALACGGVLVLAGGALLDADAAVEVDVEPVDEEAAGAVPRSAEAGGAVGVAD